MFRKTLITVAVCIMSLLSCRAAHAQFEVEEPVLDVQLPLEVENSTMQLNGQYVSIAYAYQGYLHDLKDDIVESEQYEELASIFTQATEALKTAQQGVALAEQAYSLPSVLYNTLKVIPTEYKSLATARGDTFNLAQPLIQLINLGSPGVLQQVSAASVTPVSIIPSGFYSLDPTTQQHFRARATTMAMRDSMIGTALQRDSDVQAHVTADQNALSTLESQTFSIDPAQHTELATLQRINTALVLMVREQQDANQMNAAYQMKSLVKDQEELDTQKASTAQYQNWSTQTDLLNSFTGDVNAALTYVPQ
jgi:hypothetical protein